MHKQLMKYSEQLLLEYTGPWMLVPAGRAQNPRGVAVSRHAVTVDMDVWIQVHCTGSLRTAHRVEPVKRFARAVDTCSGGNPPGESDI